MHVELCMDIIKEENKINDKKSSENVPAPQEIFDVLQDYVIGQQTAKKEFYLLLFTTITRDLMIKLLRTM